MPDPFAALGIEPVFTLERDRVERAYLARVAALHPDIASSDPEASASAAAVNDARAVLLDPEKRANALLELRGGPRPEDDRSLPPELLSEMLDVRSDLQAAQAAGDHQRTDYWKQWAVGRRREYEERVAELFRLAAAAENARPLYAQIRRSLNAWRYIERMLEQIEPGPDPDLTGL